MGQKGLSRIRMGGQGVEEGVRGRVANTKDL